MRAPADRWGSAWNGKLSLAVAILLKLLSETMSATRAASAA